MRVTDSEGEEVPAQVDPMWEGASRLSSSQFVLHFVAKLPGLGLTTFFVQGTRGRSMVPASVVEHSSAAIDGQNDEIADGWSLDRKTLSQDKPLSIENSAYLPSTLSSYLAFDTREIQS